ncbi:MULTISPECIES: hypothetical protein [unclassified Geodermatophilus]
MATATLAVHTAAPVTPVSPVAPIVAPERSRLAGDLLAVAWEPGAAPPREIRVRPELLDRLHGQLRPAGLAAGLLGEPAGLPVVADPLLPRSPGFEVRRVPPGGPLRPRAMAA